MKILESADKHPLRYIKLLTFVYIVVKLISGVLSLLLNRLVFYPNIGLDSQAVLNLLKSLGISLLPLCLFLVFVLKVKSTKTNPKLMAIPFGVIALHRLYVSRNSLASAFNSMSHPYGGNYMLRTGMYGLQLLLAVTMAVIAVLWTVETAKGSKGLRKCQVASFIFVACALLYMAVSLYFNIDNLLSIRVYPTRATEIVTSFILSAVSNIASVIPSAVYFIYWTFIPGRQK